MQFAQDTNWCDFLKTHVLKTQRKARFGKPAPAFTAPAVTAPAAAAPATPTPVPVAVSAPSRFERLMTLKEMCRASLAHAGVTPVGAATATPTASASALASGSASALASASASTSSPRASTAVERAIKQQFLKVLNNPPSRTLGATVDSNTRLDEVIQFLAEADMLDEDIPREIGRRFLHSSAVLSGRYDQSRYDQSRYDQSRSPEDREHAIKNLAPTIGMTFLP
jgi:hypothetical protein